MSGRLKRDVDECAGDRTESDEQRGSDDWREQDAETPEPRIQSYCARQLGRIDEVVQHHLLAGPHSDPAMPCKTSSALGGDGENDAHDAIAELPPRNADGHCRRHDTQLDTPGTAASATIHFVPDRAAGPDR